jgi:hypothetical protein
LLQPLRESGLGSLDFFRTAGPILQIHEGALRSFLSERRGTCLVDDFIQDLVCAPILSMFVAQMWFTNDLSLRLAWLIEGFASTVVLRGVFLSFSFS